VARGWESKGVEEQQAESARAPSGPKAVATPEQIAQMRRRDGLELSRRHILGQIQAATHPHHRKMLEATLAEIQERLDRLPKP
jgi:hypothetical protein